MATCYSCGGYKPDYGSCPTCTLKDATDRQTRALEEAQDRQTKAIALAQLMESAAADQRHQELLEKESERNNELRLQTKLIIEQSISDDEAYSQGFNLKDQIIIDATDENSEIVHSHYFELSWDFTGRVFVKNVTPDFETPRLKVAYIKGLKDRVSKEFSTCLSEETISYLAYEAGCNFTLGETGNYIVLHHFFNLSDGSQIEISSDVMRSNIKYSYDAASGRIELIGSIEEITNVVVREHFFRGINDYLSKINGPDQLGRRLQQHQDNLKCQKEIHSKNLKNDEDYQIKIKKFKRKNNLINGFLFVFGSIGLIAALIITFQFNLLVGIASFMVAIFIISIFMPNESQAPKKPDLLAIPRAYDPLRDVLYEDAVKVVLENKRASILLVQRHLKIGYNRAARILEEMEKDGLVSAVAENGNRFLL